MRVNDFLKWEIEMYKEDDIVALLKRKDDWNLEELDEFKKEMMSYKCAIRAVRTKLEVLNDELSMANQRNPIEFVKSRLKKPYSIAQKLRRRGLPLTAQSIRENLYDVAGVRVVCSFYDDIYKIADMLIKQDDITLVEVKDYIKRPKPNGYSSLHLIVRVPIYLSQSKRNVPVEIQIRTIAMDFWATLEHQMKYKKTMSESKEVINQLRDCAMRIMQLDEDMLNIRKRIDNMAIEEDESYY